MRLGGLRSRPGLGSAQRRGSGEGAAVDRRAVVGGGDHEVTLPDRRWVGDGAGKAVLAEQGEGEGCPACGRDTCPSVEGGDAGGARRRRVGHVEGGDAVPSGDFGDNEILVAAVDACGHGRLGAVGDLVPEGRARDAARGR